MEKEIKKAYEQELAKFLAMRDCNFLGWKVLQESFKKDITNLGPGCSRCQKSAIKRKYAAKVHKIFKNLKKPQ